MTPEQRERARELIEDEIEVCQQHVWACRDRDPADARDCEEDIAALRAVLAMLEEPVGYALLKTHDVIGHRCLPPRIESGEPSSLAVALDAAGCTTGAEAFEVVALLPVRKGGES